MTGKSVTHVAGLLTLGGVLHNPLQGYSGPLSASRTLKLISPRGTPYCIKGDSSKLIRNLKKSLQIPKDCFLFP